MTPYQLNLASVAHAESLKFKSENQVRNAWYMAAFTRAQRLPRLDDLFQKPTTKTDVASKIIHRFQLHNAQLKKKKSKDQ